MDAAVGALDLLGAGTVFQLRERNLRGLNRAIQKGLPEAAANLVLQSVPKSHQADWRRLIAGHADHRILSPEEGERAGRLAYILALSMEVWGSRTAAWQFLQRPHAELFPPTPPVVRRCHGTMHL